METTVKTQLQCISSTQITQVLDTAGLSRIELIQQELGHLLRGLTHVAEFWNTINCIVSPVYPVISNTVVKRDHLHQIFKLNCTNNEIIPNMVNNIVSIGNVCYLAHFFIGSKQILKNLYLENFLVHFELSIQGLV